LDSYSKVQLECFGGFDNGFFFFNFEQRPLLTSQPVPWPFPPLAFGTASTKLRYLLLFFFFSKQQKGTRLFISSANHLASVIYLVVIPTLHHSSSKCFLLLTYPPQLLSIDGDIVPLLTPLVVLQTFTRWCNSHLVNRNVVIATEKDGHPGGLEEDMSDGTVLHSLLEELGGEQLPKAIKSPKSSFQKVQNLNYCFKYMQSKDIKLVAIGPEGIPPPTLPLLTFPPLFS